MKSPLYVSARTLAATLIAFIVACQVVPAADVLQGMVRVEVTDSSGGVLPGVTIVATAGNGRVLATTVTDHAGNSVFDALPAGSITLTFQLDGFDHAVSSVLVAPNVESEVVQRLALAHLAETVLVYAKAPADVPPPPLAPPPPLVIPVPAHDQDSICGPAKATTTSESFGTIRSRRYETSRALYAAGDQLVIDGGTQTGLTVGQNVVVRRNYKVSGASSSSALLAGEHTSGLLQIVEADDRSSMAVVIYACDEIMKGDFLASFTPAALRPADPFGVPAYGEGDAARILFPDADQMLGVARRMMVIDRGTAQGIQTGQRVTLFRRQARRTSTPEVVGDAVVVAVRADSATIRVERAIDAIESGDWAAPQHRSPE